MNDDNKPTSNKRKQRQQEAAVNIYTTPATIADAVYMAREFIVCTLPHSDPGNVLSWSRTNGNLTLGIVSGINVKTGKPYGIPYGIIPRLILFWIVTEIVRTKSRRLQLGNRLADFLLKLGLDPSNGTGKRSDSRRTREQIERLINSSVQFIRTLEEEGRHGSEGKKFDIASEWLLWWNDKNPEQASLWGSWIEVSEGFYNSIIQAPAPLDIRVLRHIKDSSLGIDLYTILNREAFLAHKENKSRFIAWEWLQERTGNEYGRLDNFRRDALEQVQAILAVHSGLLIKQQRACRGRKSGLVISNLSTPSIPSDAARKPLQRRDPDRAAPDSTLVPSPPSERHLKAATIERFRAMYPRLDPYACKAAFDDWAEGLPPERKPRHYDAAFKGFAESWVVGKS